MLDSFNVPEDEVILMCAQLNDTEKATVGYYTLTKKDDIKVELTCSERVAFHKYTYPNQNAKMLLDFQHAAKMNIDAYQFISCAFDIPPYLSSK